MKADALSTYRKKRDFKQSPEPSGARRKKTSQKLTFCIQKHLASRLHYDLRLEWDGTLKSWAVPKGLSYDTTVKRLAMQVEDHPIEYGSFEGIIPSGYGAGIVLLHDHGTYEPAPGIDMEQGLRDGKLTFILKGKLLKGEWTLVRSHREERMWLVIKHREPNAKSPAADAEEQGLTLPEKKKLLKLLKSAAASKTALEELQFKGDAQHFLEELTAAK